MMRANQTHIIGVDGGGTGCRAAVADLCGTVLGRGQSGPANVSTNTAQAVENVMAAIHDAWHAARLPAAQMQAACCVLGLAGANSNESVSDFVQRLPFKAPYICDDRETNLRGAMGHGDGCLAAIGTGSFFCLRKQGHDTYIGGWGPAISDEGSGALLGREVLRLCLQAEERRLPHSDLTQNIFDGFSRSKARLSEFAIHATPGELAAYARQIVAAAQGGDVNGEKLLSAATLDVVACIQATGFHGGLPLYLVGGLGAIYARRLPAELQKWVSAPQGGALDGALKIAADLISEGGQANAG
jgi:glucosamine kinase